MKNTLITLVANEEVNGGGEAIFRSLFNEDILIKPDSEIAMQSVSLNKRMEIIEIDSNSDELTFQILDGTTTETVGGVITQYGGEHLINIKHGTYTKSNFLDLFNDIQTKMNQQLGVPSAKEFGTEIRVGLTSEEKLAFQLEKTNNMNFGSGNGNTKVGVKTQSLGGRASLVIDSTTDGASLLLAKHFAYSTTNFSKGCGQFSARLGLFTNLSTSTPAGCVLGLVEDTDINRTKLLNSTILLSDITYGIRTSVNNISTHDYVVKTSLGGDFVDGPTVLQPVDNSAGDEVNNDVLFIRLNKGKIQLGTWDKTGGGRIRVGASVDYDFGTSGSEKSYIPVIGIFGDSTTTRLETGKTSITPYNSDTYTQDDFDSNELLGDGLPQIRVANSTYKLIFGSPTLSNFLGFHQLQNSLQNDGTTSIFTSNGIFNKHIGTSTYLVELLSPVILNSYHSFSKGRKNILANIPVSERIMNGSGQIQYEPNNLFYVSMNNLYEVNLRNISLRIIAQDFSTIFTEGFSEVSLLIREP